MFISTADPTFNTRRRRQHALAGSGWQYEATFGPFLATAIGPHSFLTVTHIGIRSNVLVYQGANYTIVNYYDDPGGELRMLEVAETVPTYASLYSCNDELRRDIVVIGRGTQARQSSSGSKIHYRARSGPTVIVSRAGGKSD
jgi:hypothetical protein